MNRRLLKSFQFSHRKILTIWTVSIMGLIFLCTLSPMTSAQAGDQQIDIVNSWVEDGYIFHIDFKVQPYQVNCATTGAGFIGFNVYYKDTKNLQVDWTFGLAPWPNGGSSDSKVESHLTAYGPQAFCTKFSPCTIQNVQMVKTWCPPLE
jgi:hypothetical protein